MSFKRKAEKEALSEAKKSRPNGSITSFFAAPKASSSAVKFDKKSWVEKLTPEQKDLLKLEIDTLHESWLAQLKDDITSKEFLDLKRFLKKEVESGKKIFPPMQDVYSWFAPPSYPISFQIQGPSTNYERRSRHTPLDTVKVVILGQDPYHNVNQAHGMCFSVRSPTPAPPSLRNIYICLKKDYPDFKPPLNNGGLLTPWADRGVLLLNTCLTVQAHEANSHKDKGWERFTQRVIDLVAQKRTRGVVFMAWGTPAGKRVTKVDRERHLVLTAVHPSPLSASRGFFDCGHFKKANEWLSDRYGGADGKIDWSLTVNPAKAGV
jgi:uracil-DNA glycosylase